MNYGPLEFAAYLRRKDGLESATVKAARAASAAPCAPENRLSIVSGPSAPVHGDGDGTVDAVTVASEAAAPDAR